MHNMAQTLHTFKGETYDEAYHQMVRALGKNAVVVNTKEVSRSGLLGFLGPKLIELTASAPPPSSRPAFASRRPSLPEKHYQAHSTVGSDQNVDNTVAYLKQIVSEAQARMAKTRSTPVVSSPSPVAPAPVRSAKSPDMVDLRNEVAEMRQLLQVLVAESPGGNLPSQFVPYYRALVARGVSRTMAAELVSATVKDSDANIMRNPRVFAERLKIEIQKRITVTDGIRTRPDSGTCHTVALIGATGVGKTTNLAKLAASFAVQQRARVGLITTDTYRVAAPEQLRIYANIIGLPMRVADSPEELTNGLKEFADYDLVLIDTAGGSQFNHEQTAELQRMLQTTALDEVMLVLSANTQVDELRAALENFGCLKPTSLLFSKLDETRSYGALFEVVAEAKLPLSYFSTGQNVPDDIELATPARVAKLVLSEGGGRNGSGS